MGALSDFAGTMEELRRVAEAFVYRSLGIAPTEALAPEVVGGVLVSVAAALALLEAGMSREEFIARVAACVDGVLRGASGQRTTDEELLAMAARARRGVS